MYLIRYQSNQIVVNHQLTSISSHLSIFFFFFFFFFFFKYSPVFAFHLFTPSYYTIVVHKELSFHIKNTCMDSVRKSYQLLKRRKMKNCVRPLIPGILNTNFAVKIWPILSLETGISNIGRQENLM